MSVFRGEHPIKSMKDLGFLFLELAFQNVKLDTNVLLFRTVFFKDATPKKF